MGRAGRPQYDSKGVAVIMVHDPKKAFYKRFLYEPFPVESSLADQVGGVMFLIEWLLLVALAGWVPSESCCIGLLGNKNAFMPACLAHCVGRVAVVRHSLCVLCESRAACS